MKRQIVGSNKYKKSVYCIIEKLAEKSNNVSFAPMAEFLGVYDAGVADRNWIVGVRCAAGRGRRRGIHGSGSGGGKRGDERRRHSQR